MSTPVARLAEQDVLGLDVPMKHAGVVTRLDAVGELEPRMPDTLVPPHVLLALDDGFEEVAVREIVHGDADQVDRVRVFGGGCRVRVVRPLDDPVDSNDVGMLDPDVEVALA